MSHLLMPWVYSHRADPEVRLLADRHYNRQKPGSPQFVNAASCVVFKSGVDDVDAFWVTTWPYASFVKHAWPGAWICSAFRNESEILSSELIWAAVAATRAHYGEPPPQGMVTFVDAAQVRHKRDPGRCYVRAGFTRLKETTGGGLVVLQMLPAAMPAAESARGAVRISNPAVVARAMREARAAV